MSIFIMLEERCLMLCCSTWGSKVGSHCAVWFHSTISNNLKVSTTSWRLSWDRSEWRASQLKICSVSTQWSLTKSCPMLGKGRSATLSMLPEAWRAVQQLWWGSSWAEMSGNNQLKLPTNEQPLQGFFNPKDRSPLFSPSWRYVILSKVLGRFFLTITWRETEP